MTTDTGMEPARGAEKKKGDTGGPWCLQSGANSHVFDGRVLNRTGECVAFVDLEGPHCRLIAAAPDLLRNLKIVTDTLAHLQGENWQTITNARAAILQAAGGISHTGGMGEPLANARLKEEA